MKNRKLNKYRLPLEEKTVTEVRTRIITSEASLIAIIELDPEENHHEIVLLNLNETDYYSQITVMKLNLNK